MVHPEPRLSSEKADSRTAENDNVDFEQDAEILVVDDNPANLLAIEVALGDLGGRLTKVSSGEEALRQLFHRDFALILLDVQMPGMDGFETAKIIRSRERSRRTPIVFVTAHDRNDRDILKGYELGAVDYMFKPIEPTILRAKASVFVDLHDHAARIARQSERLEEMEAAELKRKLTMERERWDAERLRDENRRKDEFLAVLAHELRNPLAPLFAGMEVIEHLQAENPRLDRTRDSMRRQLNHLARLVDDLLDISRISSGKIDLKREAIDLRAAATQAIDSVEPQLSERNQELIADLDANPVVVDGDPVRLAQVITNLLSNASRYSEPEQPIRIEVMAEGRQAVVRVTDQGRGISRGMINKVFDQFVQEDGHALGLGLGLSLVRRLTKLHGGKVSAQSEGLGKGSRFIVVLPRIDAPIKEESPLNSQGSTEAAGKLSVVVVEDQTDIRETMEELLGLWGHDVRTASDGEAGAALIIDARPNVAIVDIGMPKMDGYGVAKAVRKVDVDRHIKLVAMTGFGQEEDVRKALTAGFDDHLTKPASAADLKRILAGD